MRKFTRSIEPVAHCSHISITEYLLLRHLYPCNISPFALLTSLL